MKKIAKTFAQELSDAYSTNNYGGDWTPVINMLRSQYSLNDCAIEAIVRSKWTRWAADYSDKPYGKVNSADLLRWMQKNVTLDQIEELTLECFSPAEIEGSQQ